MADPAPQAHSARPAPPEGAEEATCVLFECAGRRWGAALADLYRVVERIGAVVPVPVSPPWLLGVVTCDSEVATIVDLASFVSDGAHHTPPDGFTLIVRHHADLLGLSVARTSPVWHGTASLSGGLPPLARAELIAPEGGAPVAVLLDCARLGDAVVAALEKGLVTHAP